MAIQSQSLTYRRSRADAGDARRAPGADRWGAVRDAVAVADASVRRQPAPVSCSSRAIVEAGLRTGLRRSPRRAAWPADTVRPTRSHRRPSRSQPVLTAARVEGAPSLAVEIISPVDTASDYDRRDQAAISMLDTACPSTGSSIRRHGRLITIFERSPSDRPLPAPNRRRATSPSPLLFPNCRPI